MNVQGDDEDGLKDDEDGLKDDASYCMIQFHMINMLLYCYDVYSWLKVEVFDSDPHMCVSLPRTMVTLSNDVKISVLPSMKCMASQL